MTYENMDIEGIFDENGKVVYYNMCPEGSQEDCRFVTFNDDGSREEKYNCDINNNCLSQSKYDNHGRETERIDQHDISRTTYTSESSKLKESIDYYDLDGNFKSQMVFVVEDGKEKYFYRGCDKNGMNCSEKSTVDGWNDDGTWQSAGGGSCNKAEDSRCKE